MNAEIDALEGIGTSFAKNKRRDLMDLRFEFLSIIAELEQEQHPYMIFIVLGSLINLLSLIVCTLFSDKNASALEESLFLFVSVGWFTILVFILEILARLRLNPISRKFISIQSQRATPGNF
ncbi:hypothetical protein [Roseicella frigidaeris]|uniref:hypothetical protein n=1 Tax=Roseicella frigidaeris TaxID=2230885 RepID=UPI000FDEAD82|nr:hypothetical protein [Roseicella frigidaeris]